MARINISEFTVGLTICYHLRILDLFFALAKSYGLLINIANWPQRRGVYCRTLLQAQTVENQVFIVGVNRSENDGTGIGYESSSGVVNTKGQFPSPAATAGEIDWYDVSRPELMDYRREFSIRQARRSDLYRQLF
jgi:omega-amidase